MVNNITSKPIKIGIILTKLKAEKKKDELIDIRSRSRPWLKDLEKTDKKLVIKVNNKWYTSSDISMGKYIEWNYRNILVDYIHPNQITLKRFKKNDLNFMLIYDLLESFHVDSKRIFNNFQNVLKKSNNVYPPYNYQKFINNKCIYINHLSKLKDNVIPTHCINLENYKKRGLKWALNEVNEMAEKWGGKFIGKPIYGQESTGFKKFNKFNNLSVTKYIKSGMKKYPGLIFQKYIEGFDKNRPEVRVYFIDGKYRYSVITSGDKVSFPKTENGYTDLKCHKKIIAKARNTIKKLPKMNVQGVNLPHMLTRIDIATPRGFCGKSSEYFVNELEFVPSLYIANVTYIPEVWLGSSAVKITQKLLKNKKRKRN